jgi:hypothetical protein
MKTGLALCEAVGLCAAQALAAETRGQPIKLPTTLSEVWEHPATLEGDGSLTYRGSGAYPVRLAVMTVNGTVQRRSAAPRSLRKTAPAMS